VKTFVFSPILLGATLFLHEKQNLIKQKQKKESLWLFAHILMAL
jgi:hypothetical protein